jgi:CheY-like chemotaxis protein
MQPKLLRLEAVVEDMKMLLRRMIGERFELSTLHTALGAVKADPGQVQQVILNLVVNARDAMQGGGQITVETADVDLDESYCARHPGMVPGRYVMLAVSDTGSGMDDATKARLFEPFFTTKEQGKGTGLGLSTVYGIVTQSGGCISVHTALGKGSTFKIYLPLVDFAPTDEVTVKKPVRPQPARGSETILFVEDDDSVRELGQEVLEMQGYVVVTASDGADALRIFEARPPGEIHLVVTDLIMPRMGGRELAKRLTVLRAGLRVLYLSGYTDSVVMQQGMLDPGSFFLQKPFTPDDLALKVREALDS